VKIYILNKNGHSTLTIEREKLQPKVDELVKGGKYLVDNKGHKYTSVDEIPNTVEELIAGEELKHSGVRGF